MSQTPPRPTQLMSLPALEKRMSEPSLTVEEVELMMEMSEDHMMWLRVMETMMQAYIQKANQLNAAGNHLEANYFKGKFDGLSVALKHFGELKGVRKL